MGVGRILWSQTMHTFNGTNSTVLVCKIKKRVGEKWWLNSAWGALFYSESRFFSKDSMRVRTPISCLISWVLSGSVSYPTYQSANLVFKDTVCVFGTASSFNSSQLFHLMKNKKCGLCIAEGKLGCVGEDVVCSQWIKPQILASLGELGIWVISKLFLLCVFFLIRSHFPKTLAFILEFLI